MASPRSFKFHSPYELAPGGEPAKSPAKYIYIARNPKDVAVSNFHLMELFNPDTKFTGTWNAYFELFLTGKVYYGSWFDHVLGWWKNRGIQCHACVDQTVKWTLSKYAHKIHTVLHGRYAEFTPPPPKKKKFILEP